MGERETTILEDPGGLVFCVVPCRPAGVSRPRRSPGPDARGARAGEPCVRFERMAAPTSHQPMKGIPSVDWSLIVFLLILVVAGVVAGRRLWWLWRLIRSGQPAVGRTDEVGVRAQAEAVEVLGQRKLLKWTVPGLAHAFAFWGFCILGLTILEAFGALFDREFRIPVIDQWAWIPWVEDFFAVMVLVGPRRVHDHPDRAEPQAKLGRASRFYGSHTGAAWLVLFMIFTSSCDAAALPRRADQHRQLPLPDPVGVRVATGSPASCRAASRPTSTSRRSVLLPNVAVILGFLVIVVYSKHLHIFLAPFNVAFSRRPNALGPAAADVLRHQADRLRGPGEDDVFGRGKIEDFTWKGLLDFATCTECGRCQSQCPAWNTEKPLSPKLLSWTCATTCSPRRRTCWRTEGRRGRRCRRPYAPRPSARSSGRARGRRRVIDPDVLWSCTSCGACVQQCPVDIEHVDHIMDMRRYQVLIESAFPSELNGLFKNLENKGNPWGMNASVARLDRPRSTSTCASSARTVRTTLPDDVEYLFWVGCAGAFEDRAKSTTKAVAELLHMAGIEFAVLGEGETCTGDPARRSGNEFLFQMLAQQNVETLNEIGAKKIVVTCAHCFNTLGSEYPQVGGNYEVVHHTQLLNRLVREGGSRPCRRSRRRSPTTTRATSAGTTRSTRRRATCIESMPGSTLTEMPRNRDRSFCCGAGGARMWMEEKLGTRVNANRTDEAVATGARRSRSAARSAR